MPNMEVDEAQYRQLLAQARAGADAVKVVEALGNNKDTRESFLKSLKVLNPKAVIPEIDGQAPVMAALADTNRKFETLLDTIQKDKDEAAKKRMDSEIQSEQETGREMLRKNGYQTKEAIDAVEKLMAERKVLDYEGGLLLFEKLNPPASPIASTGNFGKNWDFARVEKGDDSHELLMADPTAWKNKQIGQFLAERHNQRRA